ncbi:uncharacterized protein LOC108677298, partial [Hyalella azteca]|uniref:Uncharacterized protein LOC108677298 n=1 Tax=Hyalella azteca TaxID=294128 RepID=A0A979FFR8_HYAAZ
MAETATSNAPIGRLPHLPFLGAATQRHGTNAETDAVSYQFWNKFRLNSDKPHPKTEIVFSNSSRGLNKPSARITWLGSNSGIHLDSDSGFLLLDPAAGLGLHEAKLLLSSTSGDEQELTVYADVSNIGVAEALRSTPVDLAILPRDLLTSSDAEEPNSDSSESLLDRLLKLLNQQLAEYSAEAGTDWLKSHDMSAIQPHVMTVAVETIQLSHDSHTRVWLLQRSPESQHGFSLESLIFQHQHEIKAAVGAAVLGAGVAALGECASRRVACRCCCRDIATLGQRWHLADAGDRSHAGPSLRIQSYCRCPAQDGAEEERGQLASLTSARAVTAARQPPCSRRACRNGGKCLPHAAPESRYRPGYRVVPKYYEQLAFTSFDCVTVRAIRWGHTANFSPGISCVNKQFQDLGSPGAMTASVAGCRALSCFRPSNTCPRNARCQGSPGAEQCACAPGRAGASCTTEAPSLFFLSKSYVNVALAFTPPEYWAQIELRFRTRTSDGTLVLLRSRHRTDWLSVELQTASVCLVVGLDGRVCTSLCVTKKLDDGNWHRVVAKRHSELLEIAVDEAEQDTYASALLPELRSLPFS